MIRTTLKGHGNPDQIMYYGVGPTPAPAGILLTVVKGRGGVSLVDKTGSQRPGWAASATKFWAEPA